MVIVGVAVGGAADGGCCGTGVGGVGKKCYLCELGTNL